MSPSRLIREGIESPGPAAYFAVAAASALIVLAIAGYLSGGTPASPYLPHDLALAETAGVQGSVPAGHANAVVVSNSSRVSMPVQTVHVDASTGTFIPNQIEVRAGVPVEIVFSAGTRCTRLVRFDSLGITRELDTDGTIVRLPALATGSYGFSCEHGTAAGVVFAE